jgi:hypothetical protein
MSTKSKIEPSPIPKSKQTSEIAKRLLAEDQKRLLVVSKAIVMLLENADLVPQGILKAVYYDLRYLSAVGDWVEDPARAARVLPDLLQARRAAQYAGSDGLFK